MHGSRQLVMMLALTAFRAETALAAEASAYFDIEEQPASTALLQFAQQARLSILFPSSAIDGITTGRLVGTFPIQQALEHLLEGTNISATYVEATGQLVVRAGAPQEQLADEPPQDSAPPAPHGLLASILGALRAGREPADGRQNDAARPEEITVTGTRIRQNNMTTPVPVTAVTPAEINGFAPASTLAEQLDPLPQFFQTQTAQRGGTTFLDASGSYLNLRGMGSNRALVLLDGARAVPADRQGAVNVDNFPAALIRSIEVVTGGASAAYGADAMAGVVNFIIDRDFRGLKTALSTGVTERGDGWNRHGSVTAGAQVGENLNLIASLEARRIDQIYRKPQELDNWRSVGWVTNPAWYPGAPFGTPQRLTLPHVHSTVHTPAGVINEPGFSLDRFTFTADGSGVRPFAPGYGYSLHQPGSTNTQSGGPEATFAEQAFDGGPSGNEVEQQSSFIGFKYQVDADLNLFGQTLYGKTSSNTHGVRGNPHLQDSWHGTIYADNAFLPAEVRAAMLREGIESFRFDKLGQLRGPGIQNILDDRSTRDTSRMWSATLGFEQELPLDWAVRGSIQRGKSRVTSAGFNMQRIDKLFLALDAVRDPLTGAIVCNVQLHDPTPAELQAAVAGKLFLTTGPEVYTTVESPVGPDNVIEECVPYNPFGHGNASAEADAYIGQDKVDHRTLDQDFAELLFTGNLSETGLGYGPISFAGGFTWRAQSFLQFSTPWELEREPGSAPELGIRGIAPGIFGASRGLVQFSNNDSRSGDFRVWETFGEFNVPLQPYLGSTLAYRSSDYSSSGRIESWKVGLDLSVSADLRLRATRSRDVREPTFAEHFVTVGGGGTLNDPWFAGAAVTTTIQSGGNPELEPERANTITAGFVYQPSWLVGASFAVDWYEIALFDAVSSLGAQRIVNECFYKQIYCDLITRDPTIHIIQRVINSNQNVAAARTSGVDVEMQYSSVPDFTTDIEQLTLRAFAGYLGENSTTPFAGSRHDAAGSLNRPAWTVVLSASYTSGPYGLRLQQSYYDSTLLNATWVEGRDVDDNTAASQSVTNMALSYSGGTARGASWKVSLNVNNLFDRDPPVVPSISQRGGSQTVSDNYDTFGRRYQLGFSVDF